MANEVEVRIKTVSDGGRAFQDVKQSASQAGASMEQASASGGKFSSALKGIGTAAAGFLAANVIQKGIGQVTDFINGSVEAAKDAAKVDAQLEAVIRSTGGAAGVTAQQIKDMASGFEKTTNYADDAVEASSNVLLTFTNIGGKVFPDAQKAILDMSTALGTDLQGSTIQVGKALNDPIKGITALSRVGVTFTEQQKDQIKTMVKAGDTAGAQKLILAELSKEFGGSAEAAVAADHGMQQAENRMNNLQEVLGAKMIPIMAVWKRAQVEVATVLVDTVLPAVSKVGSWLGEKLAPVFSVVTGGFRELVGGVRAFAAAFKAGDGDITSAGFAGKLEEIGGRARAAFEKMRAAILPILDRVGTAIRMFWGALTTGMTEDEGTPIESVALKLRSMVAWLTGTGIPKVVAAAKLIAAGFQAILPDLIQVGSKLGSIIGSAVELVVVVVRRAVQVISFVWSHWGDDIVAVVKVAWKLVAGVVKGALDIIQGIIRTVTAVLNGDWGKAWDGIKQILSGAWEVIKAVLAAGWVLVKALFREGLKVLADGWDLLWEGIKKLPGLAWDALVALLRAGWSELITLMTGNSDVLNTVLAKAWDLIKDGARLAWDGLKALVRLAWDALVGMVTGQSDVVRRLMGAAWDGIKTAASAAWDGIKTLVSNALSSLVGFVLDLPSRLARAAGGAWDGLIDGLADVVNKGIDYINSLIRAYNAIPVLPDAPTISHISTNTSKVASSGSPIRPVKSGYATGGITSGSGPVTWGENGTEVARLPSGTVISSAADTASRAGSGAGQVVVVNIYAAGSILSERDLVGMVSQAVAQGRIALKAR